MRVTSVSTHWVSGSASLSRASDAAQRAIPAGLEIAEIAVFLQMHFGQPFHIGNAVPAGHDQTNGRALIARERLAVQRVSQQRLRFHSVFERNAPAKLLFELVGVFPENNVLFASVRTEKYDLARLRAHAHVFQARGSTERR